MEDGNPEADFEDVEVMTVDLPNGVRVREKLRPGETIMQVKARLLKIIRIRTPELYKMIFYNADGSTVELVDQELVEDYRDLLAQGDPTRIEIVQIKS